MKPVVLAIALTLSVAVMTLPTWASAADPDTEFLWRLASGPQGERSATALPLYEAIIADDASKVSAALEHGASANAVLYPKSWSALMIAIERDDRPIVELLIQHGANLDYLADDVITPTPLAVALSSGRLHPSIEHPDFFILHRLLNAGANVNVAFGDQKDVAFLAATLGQFDILNELLDRGYRRDLSGLRGWAEIGDVDSKTQHSKDRAIATLDRLLKRN